MPASERTAPASVMDAPVVLVCAPAAVTAVPAAAASRTTAATSAVEPGRATASGTMRSPEASSAKAARRSGSVVTGGRAWARRKLARSPRRVDSAVRPAHRGACARPRAPLHPSRGEPRPCARDRDPEPPRALLLTLAALAGAACSPGADADATDGAEGAPAAAEAPAADAGGAATAFTAAELDAYERGLARETEVVRAAQERARTASTPDARGEAAQAQWEDQTMPEGARAAGLPLERYRELREGVGTVLRTLDFQGNIEGPLTLDTARASAEAKREFGRDPLAALPAASAAALRERLPRLARVWAAYMGLTAVNG
jgi:hypothetical protein